MCVRAYLPIQLSGIKDIVISIHTPSSTITATVQSGNYRGDRGMDIRLRIPGELIEPKGFGIQLGDG